MAASPETNRQQQLDTLATYIKKHNKGDRAKLLTGFAEQYFSMVSFDDLVDRTVEEVYGAMLSHWEFMYQREKGESKVRVFNPTQEQDGWESTHTIVQIAHDDMPFLVDSVRMEINRHGYLVHHIIHVGGMRVQRNKQNEITAILPRDKFVADSMIDAPIYVEIDRQTDSQVIENLQQCLARVLSDVSVTVEDWQLMLDRLDQSLMDLEQTPPPLDPAEVTESKAFLRWLKDNFILLGCRDYTLTETNGEKTLAVVPGSGAGVLREDAQKHLRYLSEMPAEARKLALSSHILIIAKTNTKSTVHRSGYTDYVGVKVFDSKGHLIGERRFIGLYTSSAYNSNPKHIPFLRLKVAKVLQHTGFVPNGHAGKKLLNILETLPRDDLFQALPNELLDLAMGIFHLQERQRIRLFLRKDSYGRFYSCLVYVPREGFNTELSRQMEEILSEHLNGEEVSYSILFSESILARIHFMVRVNPEDKIHVNVKAIEDKLIEVGRSWRQELYTALVNYFGEAQGVAYFNKYRNAFYASYKESYSPRAAAYDIEHIESLGDYKRLSMNFHKPLHRVDDSFRFKVYQASHTVPLSDALPILENMGFRVIGEKPHQVCFQDGSCAWINDFNIVTSRPGVEVDTDSIKETFQRAFAAVWLNRAENDKFNHLIVAAKVGWREAAMLRAYAKYFSQTAFPFSQDYVAEALTKNFKIARKLIDFFIARFNPENTGGEEALEKLEKKIASACDEVSNLAEDRILRHYLAAMKATVRTNYFQDENNDTIALKIMPASIPGIPLPVPMFEMFVYSPRFEAVHLRCEKVARGGLRWSDRPEDFRTEILGLMKAQQVKNSVIVPLGAKGGFVPKRLPLGGSRDEVIQEAIACYKIFISSMLSVTDNLVGETVVPPRQVVRYDEDDPYLVVAADKGTATFSDIANAISKEFNFWLGDAFASGGSAGYDHKKMGITARGAWESVKRHFREMGRDIQTTDFTAIGIGDMSGDVFGNGMLLSKHTKLVAAFNHMHIFIDPNPDVKESYKERKRLFKLARSTWDDYNKELISKGGGVFNRSAKCIKLSDEMKALVGSKRDSMSPTELIAALLKAEVDLLWNGGIGTYVKASSERNLEVGDRANDALRANGNELRCKVVGEGGNLGLTQLARVEYALNGGRIYTDFIDNSAGVDCSDHEVNIKILLAIVAEEQGLTEEERDKLLASMTDEVGKLVLENNYEQTLAISNTADRSKNHLELYAKLIDELEHSGQLNRELEFLPNEKTLQERKAENQGLTNPELAVLFAYTKNLLKKEILESELPEDPYFNKLLAQEFPTPLRDYKEEMAKHRLRREIFAMQISNTVINQMGITFVKRVQEETVAPVSRILKAFIIAQNIFSKEALWREIEKLDNKVSAEVQFDMMRQLNRLIKRATRWLLQNRPDQIDIDTTITDFKAPLTELAEKMPNLVSGAQKERFERLVKCYIENKVPKRLAERVAIFPALFPALDIVEGARVSQFPVTAVLNTYMKLSEKLEIHWLRHQVTGYAVTDHWSALARSGFSDDLDFLQRMLTIRVLGRRGKKDVSVESCLNHWLKDHELLVERWLARINDLKALTNIYPMMFYVAIRDFQDLTQSPKKLLVFR
jgi:glutamate dehydrogenase